MVTTPTPFTKLYDQLNAEQRQAVDTIEGVVMVLAGPGTGKTQILAMRIAKILFETQMDPWNILCLTFTESGVVAMRQRLISIMGPAAYHVRIHTFHSFCNTVIQEYPEKFIFARQLQVLTDVERVLLFQEIIDELPGTSPLKPFGSPYLFAPDLMHNVASLKQEHITPEEYTEIIAALEQLVAAVTESVAAFAALKPGERTPAVCRAFHESMTALRDQHPQGRAQFERFARLWATYEERVAAADGKRATNAAATALKNEVKRWFDTLRRRLPKQRALIEVYSSYQEKIRAQGRYDYEDMILFVVEKFKQDPELLATYQEQFQYILVDEYQDTNGAQNETVELLASFYDNPNIFVVGDDKQSIYRFQGASLENLLFLYQRYRPTASVIVLQENYRSQQTILDAAHALIARNQATVERHIPGVTQQLHAARPLTPAPVEIYALSTAASEHYFIAQKIKQLIATGVSPNEIAILYRRNADTDDMADMLLKMGVPIHVERGDNVLQQRIVRQVVDLLHFINDPSRDDLLWKILHFDFIGLPALDVLKLQAYAREQRQALFVVLSSAQHLQAAGVTAAERIEQLAERIAHWQKVSVNTSIQECVVTVLQESGLLDYLITCDDHLELLNCINAFYAEVKQQNFRNHELTLSELLAHFTLLIDHGIAVAAERLQTQYDAVRLMTAHRAKGLEFAHVFIMKATDHNWGNRREASKVPLPHGLLKHDLVVGEENNEDERRLFYVAMTRAKERLYITYAEHNAQGRPQVPSVFVHELPTALVSQQQVAEIESEAVERLQTLRLLPIRPSADGRSRAYVQQRLAHYVMSVTHLNNYLECPRLFYYRNLLRAPSLKTKHMAFGTAVHAALYDHFSERSPVHQPTLTELLASFDRHLAREVLTAIDEKDSRELGHQVLSAYFERYASTWPSHTLLEYDFSHHGVTIDDLPITGKIDKIEILDTATKVVNVVDYKTGNPDTKRSALKPGGNYHRQLVFYKLLADASPRFDYTMQTGEIDFVQPSAKSGAYVKQRYTITADDVVQLKATIREVWAEIKTLRFLDDDSERFCGECEYCRFVEQIEPPARTQTPAKLAQEYNLDKLASSQRDEVIEKNRS